MSPGVNSVLPLFSPSDRPSTSAVKIVWLSVLLNRTDTLAFSPAMAHPYDVVWVPTNSTEISYSESVNPVLDRVYTVALVV